MRALWLWRQARGIHFPARPNPTPYEIFGLDAHAPIDKRRLRQLYFEFVKVYHPDRGATGDAEKFKRIVAAHEILQSDVRRRRYDMHARPDFRANPAEAARYSKQHEKEFDRSLHESKMFVLKTIIASALVFMALNLTFMRHASTKQTEAADRTTQRIASELARTQLRDFSSQARVERFLHQRQLAIDKYEGRFSYKDIDRDEADKLPEK